jgi:hypothetical protein
VTIVKWLWHRLLSLFGLYGSASGGGDVTVVDDQKGGPS